MKQTAVEWLEQRIRVELTYEQDVLFDELFEQAKEMEKQQINQACYDGYYEEKLMDTRQYYDKHYNQNKDE